MRIQKGKVEEALIDREAAGHGQRGTKWHQDPVAKRFNRPARVPTEQPVEPEQAKVVDQHPVADARTGLPRRDAHTGIGGVGQKEDGWTEIQFSKKYDGPRHGDDQRPRDQRPPEWSREAPAKRVAARETKAEQRQCPDDLDRLELGSKRGEDRSSGEVWQQQNRRRKLAGPPRPGNQRHGKSRERNGQQRGVNQTRREVQLNQRGDER